MSASIHMNGQNTTIIAITFVLTAGCAMVHAQRGLPDGILDNGGVGVVATAPGCVAYSTTTEIYFSKDRGRSWKAIYAERENDKEPLEMGCVGGTASTLLFVLAPADANRVPLSLDLMRWSADGGITKVSDLPKLSSTRFASDKIGGYVCGRRVFFSGDGGIKWKEAEQLKPGLIERAKAIADDADRVTLCEIAWLSSSQAAIISRDGVVEAYFVAPDGTARPRWTRQVAGCDRLFACSPREIWVNGDGGVVRLNAADGSIVQAIQNVPLGTGILLNLQSAYVPGQIGVQTYQVGPNSISLGATLHDPNTWGVVALPDDHILVFSASGISDWDGKSASASLLVPAVDNSAVREAYKPRPEEATDGELQDLVAWSQRAGIAAGKIDNYREDHVHGTNREMVLWTIEQYKKAAAQGGMWSPPESVIMPTTEATQP